FEFVELHELVGDGDAVDSFAAILEIAHAFEDAAMLLQAEVLGFESAGGLDVESVVEEDGAEHEALGVYVGRKSLLGGVHYRHAESPKLLVAGTRGQRIRRYY